MGSVVTQAWLAEHLGNDDVRIVDCRFALGDADAGRRRYLDGHIAGAVFVDLDRDLSAPVGDGRRGRHPLPDVTSFTAAMRAIGISPASRVVAYDEGRSGGAARLWWLLRHFGHDAVGVLAGGWDAWTGPVASGPHEVAAGTFTPGPPRDDVVTLEDVQSALDRPGRLLLDARAPERYRGEVEPVDRVAGHIPGARNVPFSQPLPEDLLTADEELVVYCGSGVTACVVVHDLAAAGRHDVKLYAGSYSEWVNRGLRTEAG